jgi:hypothetical protein
MSKMGIRESKGSDHYSMTSTGEEIVKQTSNLLNKESNSSDISTPSFNQASQENPQTGRKQTNGSTTGSGYAENNDSNNEKNGNATLNKHLLGQNLETPINKSNKTDTSPGTAENDSVGASGLSSNFAQVSGDVEDNTAENTKKVNIKSNKGNMNKSLGISDASYQNKESLNLLSREEWIKYLTAKIMRLRNKALRQNSKGTSFVTNGSKQKHGQNKPIKDTLHLGNNNKFVESDGKFHGNVTNNEKANINNNQNTKKHNKCKVTEEVIESQSDIQIINGDEKGQGNGKIEEEKEGFSSKPTYQHQNATSSNHFKLVKAEQRKSENQGKQGKPDLSKKTKDVEKEEFLMREKEKKLIALSIENHHDNAVNKDKQRQSQPAAYKQTKEVKQDGEFMREKEKKLIEESTMMPTKSPVDQNMIRLNSQKANSSKMDLDQQEATFRTIYFGVKGEKGTMSYNIRMLLFILLATTDFNYWAMIFFVLRPITHFHLCVQPILQYDIQNVAKHLFVLKFEI